MDMKILMFGKGEFSRFIRNVYGIAPVDIAGYIESNPSEKDYCGKPLYSIKDIGSVVYDFVYITNAFYVTLKETMEYGVDKEKIVICSINVAMEYYKETGKVDIRCLFPSILTNFFQDYEFDGINNITIGNNEHNFFISDDYCRLGTLKLLVSEIKQNNIEGDIAELGVYQGEFCKYMNKYFPERKLHLFDTFEGFTKDDMDMQQENGLGTLSDLGNKGLDTSVGLVMEKMDNKEVVCIYQGFFPDTIPDKELSFSLVSLDCDLYQPMLEGLRYFYPRVTRGGYLMLHDYNNVIWGGGVGKAIREYENEAGIKLHKVPIPDMNGSVVISK